MSIQGIGGVFLYSNQPTALATWYAEQFGLHFESYIQSSDTEPQYYVQFFAHAEHDSTDRPITIFAIRPTDYPLDPERRECMINLEVDDLGALVAKLTGAGILVTDHHTESFGSFAHLRDLDGNQLELYEPAR